MSKVRRLPAALLLLLALLSGCGEDCPVCPANEDDSHTPSYRGWLYYVEGRDLFADLYMVDMETDSIVDSLTYEEPFFSPLGVGTSGDGRYLALGYANAGASVKFTRVFDAQSLELVVEIPAAFRPLFDDLDNLLIRASGNTIAVYQLPSFTPLFERHLPMVFHGIQIDQENKLVYGAGVDFHLYAYDYANRHLADSIHIVPWPGDTCAIFRFCLNRDYTRIYYRGLLERGPHVGCYDIESRQVLWTYPTVTWYGSVVVSPDDREVYVTDPGGDMYPNPGTIYIFAAESGAYLKGISLYGYLPWPAAALRGSEMVFSPTGEKVYVGTGRMTGIGVDQTCGSVLVVDTDRKEIVKIITPELEQVPLFMAIAPKR
jgi:hypothetical protein